MFGFDPGAVIDECAALMLVGVSSAAGVADSFTPMRFADGAAVNLFPVANRTDWVSPDAADRNSTARCNVPGGDSRDSRVVDSHRLTNRSSEVFA